jgi:ribonuclease BN (tRNA processing enzyme)
MGTLYILGSGIPTPTRSRFGSSHVVNFQDDFLMFDCGPATTYKLVKVGLLPTQINYLFFTHHHSDHNSDYPCFLLCRWDQSISREKQLKVYGPPPTERITNGLIGNDGVFSDDLKARMEHRLSQLTHVKRGGSLPRPGPSVYSEDVSLGKIVEQEKWSVTTALAKHFEPYLISLAYRLDTDDGSIVFTGDTEPCESINKLSYGADVIVVNYSSWGLLNTTNSARLAQESGAEKLILTHIDIELSTPDSKKKGLKEIAEIYRGETIISDELMKIPIW